MKTLQRFSQKLLLAVVGIAVAASLVSCSHSYRGRDRWTGDTARVEEHVRDHVDRLLEKVNATQEQRTKVYAIRDRVMPDILALVKDQGTARKETLELWNRPTLDAAKLNALVDQRADQMRALAHKLADAAGEFHAILTTEQREALQKMCEHRCR